MSLIVDYNIKELFYDLLVSSEAECKIHLSNYSKLYLTDLFNNIDKYLLTEDQKAYIEILLEACNEDIFRKITNLKYVGNKCLLYTGLYEDFIKAKQLNSTEYYKMIGVKAYDILADIYSKYKKDLAILYSQLVMEYDDIISVLNRIAKKINKTNSLKLIQIS